MTLTDIYVLNGRYNGSLGCDFFAVCQSKMLQLKL